MISLFHVWILRCEYFPNIVSRRFVTGHLGEVIFDTVSMASLKQFIHWNERFCWLLILEVHGRVERSLIFIFTSWSLNFSVRILHFQSSIFKTWSSPLTSIVVATHILWRMIYSCKLAFISAHTPEWPSWFQIVGLIRIISSYIVIIIIMHELHLRRLLHHVRL